MTKQSDEMASPRARGVIMLAQALLFSAVYLASGELSRHLSYVDDFIPLWLPAGLTVAVFAWTSRQQWLAWVFGVIFASVVFNGVYLGKSWDLVLGFTASNLCGPVLAAWLIQCLLPGRFRLDRVRAVFVLLIGSLLAPFLAGGIGSLTLHWVHGRPIPFTVLSWYCGNSLGMLLVAPLTLVVLQRVRMWRLNRPDPSGVPYDLETIAQYVGLMLSLLLVCIVVFRYATSSLIFLVALPMVGLVLRFRLFGTATGSMLIALELLSATSLGYGPIAQENDVQTRLLLSQAFVLTVGVTTLFLAAAMQSQWDAMARTKRVQQRMQQLHRETQRINQELECYAVVVSHDLKEPLRAVSGYCRFLQEDYSDVLDAEGRRFVQHSIEGADRMIEMVNALLEYSRLSRAAVRLTSVDLNESLTEVCQLLQPSIDDSGARVFSDPLPVVRGVPTLMVQLFQNLLCNAIKFVDHGKTPEIKVSSVTYDTRVVVTVADNGLGIAAQDQKRVFAIFQRLPRCDQYAGSGIGLAICERIMLHHRGSISLDSEPGNGSRFHLIFPRKKQISVSG